MKQFRHITQHAVISVAAVLGSAAAAAAAPVVAEHAAATHAAAGGGQLLVFSIIPFLATIIVFGLALLVLSKTAWPKILQGLEDRENKIREEIAAAEDARHQADGAMREYQARLAEAKAEAFKLLADTKAEQARLAADLKVKAEGELVELREAARRSIEAAKRAAVNEIYGETVALSTQIAARILQRELNPDDQRELVEQTIAEFTNGKVEQAQHQPGRGQPAGAGA